MLPIYIFSHNVSNAYMIIIPTPIKRELGFKRYKNDGTIKTSVIEKKVATLLEIIGKSFHNNSQHNDIAMQIK